MAKAEKITPKDSDTASQAGCIHGSSLNEGTDRKVRFGSRLAVLDNVPPSGKQIFLNIPNRNPADPNPVTVKVFTTVNGNEVEATYPNGALMFNYSPAGVQPDLTSFSPRVVSPDTEFDLAIDGSDFVDGQRKPVAVFAVSQNVFPAVAVRTSSFTTAPTATRIVVKFGPDPDRGNAPGLPEGAFEIFVEFSDSSAADSGSELLISQF